MKKNIKCISSAISFVTDNFFYFLYITLPLMVLLAVCLTVFPLAAILPFLFLQGVVFRLLDVKNRGYEVKAQRYKSVYRSALKNVGKALFPRTWTKVCKYYFRHFRSFFSLTVCCILFFGLIAFLISIPQLAVIIIKNAIGLSASTGDVISKPAHLDGMFLAILLLMNYLLSILLSDILLPYHYLREECKKEEAELQTIIPKRK